LDSLSGILKGCNFGGNLSFLRDSGVYRLKNLLFGVTSVLDFKKRGLVKASVIREKYENDKKIGLIHETINKAYYDNHYQVDNKKINVNDFDGYDAVMCGDLHTFQKLGPKKNIIYSGSLIQQKMSESVNNHGYVKWNLQTMRTDLIEIHNPFAYLTLEVDNGELIDTIPKWVTYGKVRLYYNNSDKYQLEKIEDDLRQRGFEVVEKSDSNQNMMIGLDKKELTILDKIMDINKNIELALRTYLDHGHFTHDEFVEEVIEHHNNMAGLVDSKSSNINYHYTWKLKYLEFSNILSYAGDNSINFEDFKGIVGIQGENGHGKSTIVVVLLYALWGMVCFGNISTNNNSSRNRNNQGNIKQDKAYLLLNKKKNSMKTKVVFTVGDTEYIIERSAERNFNKKTITGDHGIQKNKVVIWKREANSGELINLTCEQPLVTEKFIREELLGDPYFYLKTVIAIQDNRHGIVNLSESDRRNLFEGILNLDYYTDLEKYNNVNFKVPTEQKIKLLENQLKKYIEKRNDIEIDVDDLNTNLAEKKKLEKTLSILDKSKESKIYKINNIENVDIDSYNSIKCELNSLGKKLETMDNYEDCIKDIDKLKSSKNELEGQIQLVEEEKENILEHYYQLLDTVELKKDITENEISIILDHLYERKYIIKFGIVLQKNLEENKYSDSKKKIVESITGSILKKLKNILINSEEYVNIDLQIQQYKEILILNNIIKKNEKYESLKGKLINTIQDLNKKYEMKTKISIIKKDFEIKEKQFDEYQGKIDILKNNKKLEKEVEKLKQKREMIISRLKELNEIIDKKKYIKNQKEILDQNIDETKEEINEQSQLYEIYKGYDFCLRPKGIRGLIIREVIPHIKNEINNILSQIVDFKIDITDGTSFEDDQSKSYDTILIYKIEGPNKYLIESCSGFQKLIVNLATRLCLANLSQIRKPNFILTDEGYSSMDANHLSMCSNLFNYIRNHFDFGIVMTHLEQLKDEFDHSIFVKKEDYSRLINE